MLNMFKMMFSFEIEVFLAVFLRGFAK